MIGIHSGRVAVEFYHILKQLTDKSCARHGFRDTKMKKHLLFLLATAALLTACSKHVLNQELYPFRENGKWGYINQEGEIIVEPQFEDACDFVGEYAAVLLDTTMLKSIKEFGLGWQSPHWCIIDKRGHIQTKGNLQSPFYGRITLTTDGYAIGSHSEDDCLEITRIKDGVPFSISLLNGEVDCNDILFNTMEDLQRDGMLAYHDIHTDLWGFLDAKGNPLIAPKYLRAYHSNGRAWVQEPNKRWSLIDTKGNVLYEAEYGSFLGEGLSCVAIDDKFGFIDSTGTMTVKPKFYDLVDGFENGLLLAKIFVDNELKYALVDKTGKIVIGPYEQLSLSDSPDGLISFGVTDSSGYKEGYLDMKGNVVISPRFYQASNFSEGLAWVSMSEDGLYGYIDKTGEYVIQPTFESADKFHKCGLAIVKQGELSGVIDKTGKYILPPEYSFIDFYDTGMIRFERDGKYGYANTQGEIIKVYQ